MRACGGPLTNGVQRWIGDTPRDTGAGESGCPGMRRDSGLIGSDARSGRVSVYVGVLRCPPLGGSSSPPSDTRKLPLRVRAKPRFCADCSVFGLVDQPQTEPTVDLGLVLVAGVA